MVRHLLVPSFLFPPSLEFFSDLFIGLDTLPQVPLVNNNISRT